MWIVFMVFVALASFFNSLLMFSSPEWFSPFAGSLISTMMPFFGAMIGCAMRPNVKVTGDGRLHGRRPSEP